MPPELKANRTVLLVRVDNHILDHSEGEIEEEILRKNEWAGEIHNIVKSPKGNIIIIFSEKAKAT